jgi:hypothetical protein
MRLLLSALAVMFFSSHTLAMELSCEEKIGNETAMIVNGAASIDKNEKYSKTVYAISDNGKITVLEDDDIEFEQKIIDGLEWKKMDASMLGTGFIEMNGLLGTGSMYLDEERLVMTALVKNNGRIMSATVNMDCKKIR